MEIPQKRFAIRDGQRTVNDIGYGRLENGDKILVEDDGRVLVNGDVRLPQ